jgi:sugar lactone lactonase YvrE
MLALALAGCAMGNFTSGTAPVAATAGIAGRVHGGQQPISGALVQLMEPGTSGYGSAPSLIVAAVAVTDANGAFTLPRPYTCPSNSGLVYLLATGGNAGAGVNSAIAEAAIVGNCNSLSASTFVNISEVTTIAAAYALAPFATITAGTPQTTNVGTSLTNLQGLYNAAGPAANLANNLTGFAHVMGDIAGVVPPTSELNTLADILASCINQGTPNNPAGNCTALFSAAKPSGGLTPTDTFQAAIDIAQHPGANVSTLFGLVPANAPFQPTLPSAPNDFSVALGYNGGAITLSGDNVGVAIDATGNAWITDQPSTANPGVHSLTEITPAGAYPGGVAVASTSGFGISSIGVPVGLAIDQSGYIWVCNNSAQNLLKFNPNPVTLNSTITATSFSGPNAVAFDGSGDAWVADFGAAGGGFSNVTEINTSGVEATGSPFTGGQQGVDVAVSPTAVWQTNAQSNYVWRIALSNHAVTTVQIGGSIGDVAIDHANNAWLAVTGNGSIFEISDAGGYVNTPFGGYQVSGTRPQNIAIDGLGNVFSGSYLSSGSSQGTLLEYSNSAVLLSPGTGFTGSAIIPVAPSVAGGIAIDGSGNVWLSGFANGTGLLNYVTEVIGIAAPVVTPRATATTNNTLGTRP